MFLFVQRLRSVGEGRTLWTPCTEYCTVLLFANSTNIVYLILSAKLTKTGDVRNEVIVKELRITLLVLENVNVSQHLNSYLKAVYFVREI